MTENRFNKAEIIYNDIQSARADIQRVMNGDGIKFKDPSCSSFYYVRDDKDFKGLEKMVNDRLLKILNKKLKELERSFSLI